MSRTHATSNAAPDPVSVLPLAQPSNQPNSMIIVEDGDQILDHSRRPVPPVTSAGFPYRFKVRLRGRNVYASTADEVLALFIDDYLPHPPPGREAAFEQIRRRGDHCIGVIVTHVANALLEGTLDDDEAATLQRSADYGTGRDPITATECVRWSHPEVEMWLMGDLYAPEYGRFTPPAGNIRLLWPGRADRYLHDLAGAGLIALSENPATTATPMVELRGTTP